MRRCFYIEKEKNKKISVAFYFSFYSYYILVFIVRVYEMFFLRYILELHMVKSREKYVQKMTFKELSTIKEDIQYNNN